MNLFIKKLWRRGRRRSHVVTVGAGFGKLSAARELEKNSDVDVTIVDRTSHHLCQLLLCRVATGSLNAAEIASLVRTLFEEWTQHAPDLKSFENATKIREQVLRIVRESGALKSGLPCRVTTGAKRLSQ